MTVHVRGCHLGPPQISQKLLICAQSLSCLCQCSQAMGQRMGSEFLCQRKNFHLPKQCSEKCNADHSELHLQVGILKTKNVHEGVNLYTFLENHLSVEIVLDAFCQVHRTWPTPQDGEPNSGMENIFSA